MSKLLSSIHYSHHITRTFIGPIQRKNSASANNEEMNCCSLATTPHTCWPARSQPVPHLVSSLKSTFCLGSEEQPPHHSKVVHTRWCNTFTSCHLRCQQFSELWAALTLPSRVSKHWRFCLDHCG